LVNEKIVVTGSSGQLGTRLIPNLLKLGYQVIGIDIDSPKNDLKYIFLEADLTKKESSSCFKDILNDAKIAIHLAGKINDSQKIRDFGEKIISIIKSKSVITKFYRKTDFDSIVDISKAENKLDFKPKTCLDEGLKYEIEWHKKTNDTKMVN